MTTGDLSGTAHPSPSSTAPIRMHCTYCGSDYEYDPPTDEQSRLVQCPTCFVMHLHKDGAQK